MKNHSAGALDGIGELGEFLASLADRVHAAGGELRVEQGRLRIVMIAGGSARRSLGILLYSDVRAFARRLCAWLQPARCPDCGICEVPTHGARCEACRR